MKGYHGIHWCLADFKRSFAAFSSRVNISLQHKLTGLSNFLVENFLGDFLVSEPKP
jgi:hypothetical protein